MENIFELLCLYDKRHPNYDEELGEAKKRCFCDNCFYGRSELANMIIEQKELITLLETALYSKDWDKEMDSRKKLPELLKKFKEKYSL